MFSEHEDGFVFLDGAAGTMLQKLGLKPGQRPDIMNITAPDAVESVAKMYVEAGSDIIYTNTFGANASALRETGYSPEEIITAAVSITKRACGGKAKTALDIGPLGGFIEPLGDISFQNAYELFKEQASAGEAADLAVIETMSDLMELKAAIMAVRDNTRLPIIATMTFDKSGRTFAGCLPESFAITAQRLGVLALGINCSLEPPHMLPVARRISHMTTLPLVIKPNAGLPDSVTGLYGTTPSEFAAQMACYAELGARYIGGCCGTTPEFITELRRVFANLTPTDTKPQSGTFICSPSRFEKIDGFKPLRRGTDCFTGFDEELKNISSQADNETAVLEICLPDDPSVSAQLITAVREIANLPMLLFSGCAESLDAALCEISGIAAVSFTHGTNNEMIKAAGKYGAVILSDLQ